MRKVQSFGDTRNKGWCVHCGGANESQDHAPSRVFLDEPYPDDLPATPSCLQCNNGFSDDEAYVAALLECVMVGACDPAALQRPKIAKLLEHNPHIAASIDASRTQTSTGVVFDVNADRVRNVVLKLARGHAAFELNEPQLAEATKLWFAPISSMSDAELDAFENNACDPVGWPEVGSRAMGRLLIVDDQAFEEGWLVVQKGRYRYRTSQDEGIRIRFVIREYLACDVQWN